MGLLQPVFEDSDGGRLRAVKLGSGPPLVLLHGWPETLQIWSALAPRLAARHQVLAFDWPGLGFSQSWKGRETPFHMAGRLLAILEAWGALRPAVVALGAGVPPALVAAAKTPARIERLVLMNAPVFPAGEAAWKPPPLLGPCSPPGESVPPALEADFREAMANPAVRLYARRVHAEYRDAAPKVASLCVAIGCPTLVLWGGRDGCCGKGAGERLSAAIPDARLRVLPEGGHWMAWHQAAAVADAILAFLPEG